MSERAPSVLLIARHYPPEVSAGARRPLLLAEGLEACGASVAVVAPTLPDGARGLAVPALSAPAAAPAQDAAPAKPLRSLALEHLSLPDPELRWSLRAARAALAWARETDARFDWVLSTSPPESVHVAGALLAARLRARWAADMRDRWLEAPLLPVRQRRLRRLAERPLARAVLARADLLAATDPPALAEAERLAPRVRSLLVPQASPAVPERPAPAATDAITVLHTGSFSLSHGARDVGPALDLFARAKVAEPRFALHLVGRLTLEEVGQAEAAGAVVHGPLPLEEAWARQAAADVLLLVAAPGTEAVPGKLAEYRAARRPVVVLGGGSWRRGLPGGGRDPLEQLLSMTDPGQRAASTPPPGPTPAEVARPLLDAMRDVDG